MIVVYGYIAASYSLGVALHSGSERLCDGGRLSGIPSHLTGPVISVRILWFLNAIGARFTRWLFWNSSNKKRSGCGPTRGRFHCAMMFPACFSVCFHFLVSYYFF